MVASDGGAFAFGDARFHGSLGGKPLNGAVVELAPTPLRGSTSTAEPRLQHPVRKGPNGPVRKRSWGARFLGRSSASLVGPAGSHGEKEAM